MDKLRQELSTLHIEKALDIATRDGAFAKEMYAGFGQLQGDRCARPLRQDV